MVAATMTALGVAGATAATGTAAAGGAAAASSGGILAGVGGLSGAASIAGTGAAIAGTVMQNRAAQAQAAIQNRILKTEAEGAKIEAARQRRQIVRETLRAQAMSEVAAGAGGALQGSGIQGGIAQAMNSGIQGTRDVNQNLGMALNISDMKRQQQNVGMAEAQMLTSLGTGISSLSQSVAKTQQSAQRVYGPLSWLYGA
jgi:hypothetical protein